jgi:hypothetical protein
VDADAYLFRTGHGRPGGIGDLPGHVRQVILPSAARCKAAYTLGGFIHILLFLAIVTVIVRLIQRRRIVS